MRHPLSTVFFLPEVPVGQSKMAIVGVPDREGRSVPGQYKFRDYLFGRKIITLRKKTGLTQEELAIQVGVSEKALRNWEAGIYYPTAINLQKLIEIYLHKQAFPSGLEQEEARALWDLLEQSTSRSMAFDEEWFQHLLQAQQPPLSNSTAQASRKGETESLARLEGHVTSVLPTGTGNLQLTTSPVEVSLPRHQEDWGEALDVSGFAGRKHELDQMERWVLGEQCRLVVLLGMGGIGKTALATRFAQQVATHFEVVLWRSLRNAPSLEQLLNDCLQLLVDQRPLGVPQGIDQQLTVLIEYLRQHRCLLVLDNIETIFQEGEHAGSYRPGYEDYRTLFLRVGGSVHQSCLLLTSRETPAELNLLLGTQTPVRVLKMAGLTWKESRAALEDEVLFGDPLVWRELSERYAGNPLALKIVAGEVRELFGGDIAAFLREGPVTFQSIRTLLTQQVERLSSLEQEVLYWLTIERDWLSLGSLRTNMVHIQAPGDLLEALGSLRRRSLIERGERGAAFTLQPVVLEYLTDRLTRLISHEILIQHPTLLLHYPLVQAQAKDYIRDSQKQLILQPVLDQLLAHLRDKHRVEEHLDVLIQQLRALPIAEQGYGGGSVVNLLVRLNGHLKGKDCSQFVVRQADLREAEAHDANFAGTDLSDSVFLETLNGIVSVALSPDGQYIAGGGMNGEIRIWRVRDGQLLLVLAGHVRQVWALAFHPDSTRLISGGYDGQVKVWEVQSGQCLSILRGHTKWIRSLVVHPTGELLATGSHDKSIRLWNLSTGHCIKRLEQHNEVWALAFSPDGRQLAAGYADRIIKLWDLESWQCLWNVTTHREGLPGVCSLAFSPTGELLASGGENSKIMVWQASSGRHMETLNGHTDIVYSMAFSTEGLLASGSFDRTVRLWQVGDRETAMQCLGALQEHADWLWSVTFNPEGLLASGGQDGVIKLWQINTESGSGKCIRTVRGYARIIETVAFSPAGKILASGENNGPVRLWETASGLCLHALSRQTGETSAMAFSPDGRLLARGSSDNVIRIWEVDSGRCLRTLERQQATIWSVVFSPDGRFLASGRVDTTIKIWDVESGACLITPQGHNNWVWSVTYSPDGRLLASGDVDGVVKVWDLSSGQCLHTLHGSSRAIMALAFTSDGQTLLSSNGQDLVTMWDVQSGNCLKVIPGMNETYWPGSVSFSADGSLLATTSSDQTVKVWRVNDGELLHVLPSHAGRPWSVAWSANQLLLACGTDEGAVLLWDMQTGNCLMTLRGDRPYERMNISGVTGITEAQKASLKILGAIEIIADTE